MNKFLDDAVSKVPAVTLGFWIVKILATTLGETGGDAVTMTLRWGYLDGTALFAVLLVIAVAAQIKARRFHPFVYWLTIVATTTVGTTLADFLDRSLGIGYIGGSSILLALVNSVTGVAGPAGGTPAKPVGMVCFGWAVRGLPTVSATRHFPGDRAAVRVRSVRFALEHLLERLDSYPSAQ